MNYFSRVVVLAASWAHTTVAARAQRDALAAAAGEPALVEGPRIEVAAVRAAAPAAGLAKGSFAAGAGVMLALVAVLRRKKD